MVRHFRSTSFSLCDPTASCVFKGRRPASKPGAARNELTAKTLPNPDRAVQSSKMIGRGPRPSLET